MSRDRRPTTADDRQLLRRTTRRLGLQIGLLLFGCLAVVAAIAIGTVIRGQQAQTISLLDDAIAVSHGSGGAHTDRDDRPELGAVDIAVTDPYGYRVSASMPAGLPDRSVMAAAAASGVTDQRTVTVGGRRYAVRTVRHGDDTVQAVYDLGEQRGELIRLLRAIALAAGVGLLISVAGSAWLARRAVRPMADALALQRRFVADASHELRTPLTLLSTRAQLIARRLRHLSQPGSEIADGLTGVERDANGLVADAANLNSILEDLLTAADPRIAADRTPVDLTAIAREATAAAEAFAADSGIGIVTRGEDPVRLAAANRAALLRAVTALLDNAIAHARSTVELTVRPDRDDAVIEVADDGPGIAVEVAPTLFERFATSRSTSEPGRRRHYGLGLALVAEIARAHGGSVAATTRAGSGGAVLVVRLPRTATRPDGSSARPRSENRRPTEGGHRGDGPPAQGVSGRPGQQAVAIAGDDLAERGSAQHGGGAPDPEIDGQQRSR